MNLKDKKLYILQALIDQKGLQGIIDSATEVINNPIFLSDRGIKVVAHSNVDKVDDVLWDSVVKIMGPPVNKYLNEIKKTGDGIRIYSEDEPIIRKYSFTTNRYMTARIRYGKNVLGHMTVIETWKNFEEDDEKLLVVLCRAIVFTMLNIGQPEIQSKNYFSLFNDLLDNNIKTLQEFKERALPINVNFPKIMRLVIVQQEKSSSKYYQFYVYSTLSDVLKNLLCIIRDEEIVILCDIAVDNISGYLKKILNSTSNPDVKIGVSREFCDPLNLPVYYHQAKESIRLSNFQGGSSICMYDELYIYHLLDIAARTNNLINFCDPLLLKLSDYDKKYSTEYLLDLKIYLNCGKNIHEAAKKRHIHKNSMYYRISRIEEVLDFSLNDEEKCFLLQLSYRILQMINE